MGSASSRASQVRDADPADSATKYEERELDSKTVIVDYENFKTLRHESG